MQSFKAVELYKEKDRDEDTDRLANATACTSTPQRLFVAKGGNIYMFSRTMRPTSSFSSMPEIRHMSIVRKGRVLLALGSLDIQADIVSSTCITIWHFAFGSASEPRQVLQYELFKHLKGVSQQKVTAWACFDDGEKVMVAVGLHTSPPTLVVIEFRISTNASGTCNISKGKPVVIQIEAVNQQTDGHIGDLCFVADDEGRKLFIATQHRVLSIFLDHPKPTFNALQTTPVQQGCMCQYEDDKSILGWSSMQSPGSEATAPGYAGQLCTYTHDARAACIPLQYIPHSHMTRLGPQLVTFLAHKTTLNSNLTLTILDLKTRLEVHKEELRATDTVSHLVSVWGGLLVLRTSGQWSFLHEEPLPKMLAALLRKRIYEQAMTIARGHASGTEQIIADIEAQYASHLLERAQEPEAAMSHFINTIGFLPVSAVVKSFMGMQHAGLLAQYLEQVHQKGFMQAPHVRVLLGLYCQMRDTKQLEAFVSNSISDNGYKYDAEEAIKILLTGGYFELATNVARVEGLHAKVIDILLHQLEDAESAITYIATLTRPDQAVALIRHGAQLIRDFSMEMKVTSMIGTLCTVSTSPTSSYMGKISQFSNVYSHAPGALRFLCEFLKTSWSTADDCSSPSVSRESEERSIYHLLMQIYLSDDLNRDKDGELEEVRHGKAEQLLLEGWPPGVPDPKYSYDHALSLCHLHRFKAGLLFLFHRRNDRHKMYQVYMQFNEHRALINAVRMEQTPEYWYPVLRHLVAVKDAEVSETLVREVLDILADDESVHVLQVLDILSKSETLTLGAIRAFFLRHVEKLERKAHTDKELMNKLSHETASLQQEVDEKRTHPLKITTDTDSTTGAPLGSSAVHFFCGHAYNEDTCEQEQASMLVAATSVSSPAREVFVCRECKQDRQHAMRALAAARADTAKITDTFFTELRSSKGDGFRIIAKHLAHPATII